jgi:hypothetical protein
MREGEPNAINAQGANTTTTTLDNNMVKWVRLPDDVHKELTELTSKSETYAESIQRLIKFWKEHHKK